MKITYIYKTRNIGLVWYKLNKKELKQHERIHRLASRILK